MIRAALGGKRGTVVVLQRLATALLAFSLIMATLVPASSLVDQVQAITAEAPAADPTTGEIGSADVQSVTDAAEAYWPGEDLSAVSVEVADLGGDVLAQASGDTIVVDATAGGHGWHVGDEEVPADEMDLLTVVAHELGHVFGADHAADGVMDATLAPGERIDAEPSTIDEPYAVPQP